MNSIRIPAVIVNQIAANTGAVVRNFFMDGQPLGQRGETVTWLSGAVSLLLANSLKAASGQVAAARVLLNARGRSIWISFVAASLPLIASS